MYNCITFILPVSCCQSTAITTLLQLTVRRAQTVVSFACDRNNTHDFRYQKRRYSYNMATMKTIGTHNGTFHCDEVLACYMLKCLPEYKSAKIVRTREQKLLDLCDIVVDVGGVYDYKRNRYDHHQRSFDGTMQSLGSINYQTKLSSAGLIYLHYGHRVISEIVGRPIEANVIDTFYNKVYEKLVEEVDAIDNGIAQTKESPKYIIQTNLSARVSFLNPAWNDEKTSEEDAFYRAIDLVGSEFNDRVLYFCNVWYPAREIVEASINNRFNVHESGEIIALENGCCPWKEHLYAIEEDLNIDRKIKFVLYTDQLSNWRVQCVPIKFKRYENRLSLLEEWRGIRDKELSTISGIADCVFVHAGGFIGGNKRKEGALQMAIKTLQSQRI